MILQLTAAHKKLLADIDSVCMSVPWTVGMFENELSNESTCYFGVFVDNALVGYGGMWLVSDEAQITNIAVMPEYRRRGLGNAIIAKLAEKAKEKGALKLLLEVRESNENAISLYKKNGFTVDGIRKSYYKSPTENAVLMSKIIH